MAAFIHDTVLDQALSYIDSNCENLYICSTQPTTFAEASSTYKLGTKATPSIGAPTNGDSSGRKIVVAAITDGTVSANGTAGFVALTDDSASMLLAVQALNATQVLTSGNTFTLTEFDITIPDPA
ncbi:MAG: hypothetical protein CVU46_10495 [Chloroflexi bacterium HGW-Chloroflexi-8]|nr:MAG: hypothetical protein CVU46_10495 [Chloroflexi bacterium HGW-Chloroflexi-8]